MTDPTPEADEAAIAKAVRCLEGAAANDGGIPAVGDRIAQLAARIAEGKGDETP